MWWPASIDTWCSRTNRKVDEESLWIFRAPAATSPPVELQRRIIDGKLYAIVWDTDYGHLI